MPAVWSNDQIVSNLLRDGARWSGTVVTYGFPASAPNYSFGTGEGAGFSAATAAQRDMARLALQLWDDLIAVDFQETTASPQITIQNSTTGIGYAHAYMPTGSAAAGDVWLNPTYNASWGTNDVVTPKIGQWGALTYVHELGHALGLEHPGEYNGGSPTYAANALYSQDTIQYSVMSYFDANNTGADWVASDGRTYYAQTPMLHDILAIQALYGVETTTRTGDTRYGFNSTAGNVIYDFTQNKHPIMTLWDSGGNDWLDLSGFTSASRIDLNAGAFSDCDGMTKNIAISYGCEIENAAGGYGNDSLLGNALNNILQGNSGNDTLTGGAGADILIGGDGNDIFYADEADFLLQFDGGAGYDILYFTGSLNITYTFSDYGFEEMVFLAGSGPATPPPPPPPPVPVVMTGTAGANTLIGNATADIINGLAGNDTLAGNGGDDVLNGGAGNDRMDGGSGIDTASYEDAGSAVTVSLAVASAQVTGGSGRDTLAGFENLRGSAYGDTLTGSSAANTIEGLAGNDRLDGGMGADILIGGNGDDQYVVDNAGDVVNESGTNGTDTVLSSVSFSLADGSHVLGLVENLTLTGAAHANATGNSGNNLLSGNAGNNILDGGDGTDTVSYADSARGVTANLALATAQAVATGLGSDTLLNIENVTGSNLGDVLTGSAGNNILAGLAGNDMLSGAGGSDRLIGGAGVDVMTGGADGDIFVFESVQDSALRSRDTITGFQDGADKIDLSAIDAVSGGSDNAFRFVGASAFTKGAGQLQSVISGDQTIISADVNGDKRADFSIVLSGVHVLQESDFIL